MAYPVAGAPWAGAAANPAYSGTFIPEIWSGQVLEKFYAATVLAQIANTSWEGEIKGHGDKVKIRTKPTIAIASYQADQSLTVTRPASNVIDLLIDQGFYWNTVLDDVMEVQADLDQLSMWADDASEQMKIKIDTEVLAYLASAMIAADTNTDNSGTTAGKISGNINLGNPAAGAAVPIDIVATAPTAGQKTPIDMIVDMGQALDEQNIPETGRWIVVPAWFASRIKKSELRDASLTGDGTSILRNGRLGMVDRFTIYSSNLLPTTASGAGGAATYIFAGHQHGLTFASQLSKVETLRAESTFGTLLRGLQVYGRKLVDFTAITLGAVRGA